MMIKDNYNNPTRQVFTNKLTVSKLTNNDFLYFADTIRKIGCNYVEEDNEINFYDLSEEQDKTIKKIATTHNLPCYAISFHISDISTANKAP